MDRQLDDRPPPPRDSGIGQHRRPRRPSHSHRPELRHVLFVAHREEILQQSWDTFRRIRPDARLGFYMGQQREADADVLFASIQTLGQAAHLERFPRDGFAIAPPRNAPTGATSWPCARRTSSTAATSWRASSRTSSAASGTSASRTRWTIGTSPGATPVSTRRSSPDTSPPNPAPKTPSSRSRSAAGPAPWLSASPSATRTSWTSVPRAQSLDELSEGRLDVICAVDVFNEGLDLPELDTVLMLRPTESRILWLQQLV